MADAKRLFDHDQHRAEEVGETVAGRERHGQTTDAQPSKDRLATNG